MAKERPPAFQYYPKDFLSDPRVAQMSAEAVGAYWLLISYCWLDKDLTLPAADGDLMGMARLTPKRFKVVWPLLRPCFQEISGGFTHRRLMKERAKQREHSKAQRDNGIRGAESRWRAHRVAISKNGGAMATDGSSSSSSSSSSTPVLRAIEKAENLLREDNNAKTIRERREARGLGDKF